jgi:hypothetical protein
MKKCIAIFAVVPVLGWLASLVHNVTVCGEFFCYSDVAYLPLHVATFPFMWLIGWLSDMFGEHTHRVFVVYTLLCAATYGLVGAAVYSIVRRHAHAD